MRKDLYNRQVSLIDGLALQGASIEEISCFLNLSNQQLLDLMDYECIKIIHRDLTEAKLLSIDESRTEFISKLSSEEGYSDLDISKLFNISLEEVRYYKEPFASLEDLLLDINKMKCHV